MRSRNIKPGFLESDVLASCSIPARYLFAGLWMVADREGRMEDRPLRIKGQVFRFDSVDIDALLGELVVKGFVVRYEVAGCKYLWIPNFLKHQTPHKNEKASTIPPYSGNVPSESRNGPNHSALIEDRGLMIEESGMRKEECPPEPDGPPPELLSWIDWWNDLKTQELVAAGVSREPISEDVKRGWNRVCESKTLRQLLADRELLATEIRACAFLREGWFTLGKLLGGKNREGAYIVQRIVDGGYRDDRGRGKQSSGKQYRRETECDFA